MLMTGLLIAAAFGMCGMLMARATANGNLYPYLINIGAALVYAAINLPAFRFAANKKYRKIEG